MMWNSGGQPDRLTTPPVSNTTDHFNNNPYSRNSSVSQPHSAVPKSQQNRDPWSWGWDDNGSSTGQVSGGQDDDGDLWRTQPASHLQPQQRPEQQQFNANKPANPNNSSDFFENIDLKSSTPAPNNLFSQPPPQSQYSYSYHSPPPPLPQQQQQQQPPPPQSHFLQQQPQLQPQISTNSSYSYFQFSEPQQTHPINSTPLVNQYSSPLVSHSQPAYSNHMAPHFQPPPPSSQPQPQTQSQFIHSYNQFSSVAPSSQQQMVYNNSRPNSTTSIVNSNNIINNNNNNSISAEVENREIAPPEKVEKNLNVMQSSASTLPPLSTSLPTSVAVNNSKNNNIVPENQETVPENEERPPNPDTIASSMNNLRLNSPPASESISVSAASNDQLQWNSVSGWENQEIAPRCTVDRDQYLETGHLHPPSGQAQSQQSSSGVDNDVDIDPNDEGEAAPPPGLHRLVTGQGQNVDQERLVVGSPPPPMSSSAGPTSLLQRPQVLGHSMQQQSDSSTLPTHPPLGQRMIPGQLRDDDMQRMVLGGSGNSTNDNMSSNQQSRDPLQMNPVSQRTVPGGRSNDMPQPRDREQPPGDHVSQRTVPGGSSTSTSSVGSNSSYAQLQDLPPEERLVLGRPTIDQGDDRLQPPPNSTGISSSASMWTTSSMNANHQDPLISHQGYPSDSDLTTQQPPCPSSNSNSIVGAEQSRGNSLINDPPPGLHRMVLGHPDNSSRGGSASGDEMSQSGVPPPGLHRMVLGEQQQEQKPPQQSDQQQLNVPSQPTQQTQSHSQGSNADNDDCDKDRDIDSDSDYRINRRKQHHRRDSVEDDNYPSDRERERDRRHPGREYWERRYDDRNRRQKDRSGYPSYDHSPEYRSEEELDRERTDYRDHRDYRPPRPRDRDRERGDRRKQSPDYYYRDDDYRDDQRRSGGRGGRYYDPHHYRGRDVYEDDYYYRENRSRPSSRSGVEYPRRHGGAGGPRDYMPARNVHPYYQDQGTYQMNYYQMQQHYYEMRRNDPQAYAAWYEQYMASKFGQGVHRPDDSRTSVLSGRSSANHHRSSNEKVIMEDSINAGSNKGMINASGIPAGTQSMSSMDHQMNKDNVDGGSINVASQRYTPQLYSGGAHIRAKWSKQGQLVVVSPNYPREGQPAIVEVMQLAFTNMQNDPDILEFLEFPGPFTVGVTHKNTVLQYLKKRGDQASHNAEKLLYELMQLVIRLNGVVDMTDVADLLMNNYNEDPGAEHDQHHQQQLQQQYCDTNQQQDNSAIETSSQQVLDRFRDLLLQGNKQDALEWAIQNKNWGHAFFLSSKMDTRSYNNVMLRFANGLPANDPLQTLYQMMSGREPQAATCCADHKWGDWRPHLAMMLSNPSGNPDLDRKSIINLGDSLANRGRLFASHFCYVTAQVEFAAYTDRNAKLVLLGSSHLQPFAQFATCRSIMLTLCYEYAKRLNKKDLTIPALQIYKYLLATRLIENGKLALASQYLEAIALDVIHRPARQNRPLALLVAELADQIKMSDPALAMIADPNDDPDWLNMLKQILDDTNDTNLLTSSMSHGISTSTVSTSAEPPPITNQVVGGYAPDQVYYENSLHAWNNQPDAQNLDSMQYQAYSSGPNIEVDQYNQHQYQQPPLQHLQPQMQQQVQIPDVSNGMNPDYNMVNSMQQPPQQQNSVSWDTMNMYPDNLHEQSQSLYQPQQIVSPVIPPVTTSTISTTTSAQEQKKASPEKKSNKDEGSRRSGKKNKEQSSGWFGGIFDKFAFRPKNEMKLPDDKNPSIVWDEKKGKWVNKDADEEEEAMGVKPPPKASELPGFSNPTHGPTASVPALVPASVAAPIPENNIVPVNAPAAASTPNSNNAPTGNGPSLQSAAVNKFKMQRGRGMKANYIDVMNPNSSKKPNASATIPPPMMDPVPTAAAPVNNFFIPAPVEGNDNAPIDFVSPSGPVSYEVSHKPLDQAADMNYSSQGVPTFYNPSGFTMT